MQISRIKIIFFTTLFLFISKNSHSQYVRYTEDTAKFAFGIGAKAGIIYDYPLFYNKSALSPIGELDFYFVLDKIQINTGFGFFANNSAWRQGADQVNPEKTGTTNAGNFFIPLNVDFRLFNVKRNLLFIKVGFNFLFSTNTYITENMAAGTFSYQYQNTIFGMGGYLGLKYSRHLGNRILLSAELDLNLGLAPSPAALLGTDYSSGFAMASRHPNGDFKISFQYILGKKHLNILDPSKRKKKKEDQEIIDED